MPDESVIDPLASVILPTVVPVANEPTPVDVSVPVTVAPAATVLTTVLPSTSIVTAPVPLSVTVTLESPCAIEFWLRPANCESTYAFVVASEAPDGVPMPERMSPPNEIADESVDVIVEPSILIESNTVPVPDTLMTSVLSPMSIPFLTLKFLVAMVHFPLMLLLIQCI